MKQIGKQCWQSSVRVTVTFGLQCHLWATILATVSESHSHLRPIVLDVVGRLGEDLRLLDGVDEDLSLRGAAPVGLGVPKYDS